eukprot:2494014-Rhodomonas_salina.2
MALETRERRRRRGRPGGVGSQQRLSCAGRAPLTLPPSAAPRTHPTSAIDMDERGHAKPDDHTSEPELELKSANRGRRDKTPEGRDLELVAHYDRGNLRLPHPHTMSDHADHAPCHYNR